MTTQREPDTSAEEADRAWASGRDSRDPEIKVLRRALQVSVGSAINELVARKFPVEWSPNSGIGVGLAALGCYSTTLDDAARAALADAAGQAATVPPPVEDHPGWLESIRKRVAVKIGCFTDLDLMEKAANAFAAEHDRAEGLAKEVERLEESERIRDSEIGLLDEEIASLKAKLAVYEAPIGDGEVETIARALEHHECGCGGSCGQRTPAEIAYGAHLLRRLSAAHAECKGENTKLREALGAAIKIAGEAREEWDKAPDGMKAGKLLIALSGRMKGYRADIDAIHATCAALAPASGEKAT